MMQGSFCYLNWLKKVGCPRRNTSWTRGITSCTICCRQPAISSKFSRCEWRVHMYHTDQTNPMKRLQVAPLHSDNAAILWPKTYEKAMRCHGPNALQFCAIWLLYRQPLNFLSTHLRNKICVSEIALLRGINVKNHFHNLIAYRSIGKDVNENE